MSRAASITSAEPDLARHVRKLAPIKIILKPLPGEFPIRFGTHDRVDAKKRYASQDKRSNGSRQIHAAGQSTRRNSSAIPRHGQHIRERGRADAIDAAGPALFCQWFRGSGEIGAPDDFVCAEFFQVVGLLPAGQWRP